MTKYFLAEFRDGKLNTGVTPTHEFLLYKLAITQLG